MSALALAVGCEPSAERIALWPGGAPGAEARRHEPERAQDWWVANIHDPSLSVFRASRGKSRGAGVVIMPGGGHRELVFGPEGVEPARLLARHGLTAFALKYRLARAEGSPYTLEHARDDALRAVRWVRHHAADYGLDPHRIGVMGWSAGGELAAMASHGAAQRAAPASDAVDAESARPDFQILIYPGARALPEALPRDAPDSFLLAAADDLEPAETVSRLFALYRAAGRPVELHLLARGGHGFNLGQRSELNAIRRWPERLLDWLEAKALIAAL